MLLYYQLDQFFVSYTAGNPSIAVSDPESKDASDWFISLQ